MLLIISKSKRLAAALADTFYYMSILSYPATPKEALSEISPSYHAAIILEPEAFPDIKDYICKIKSLVKEIPIFIVTNQDGEYLSFGISHVFCKNTETPIIAAEIKKFCIEHGAKEIGKYKLAGFDASSDRVGISYFYSKPNLTKTELMIFRYLISSYPTPKSANDILRHAFRSSRVPEASSVRTHISSINKKLMKFSGRRIIELSPGEGYYITTPEILQNRKIM